MKLNQSIKPSFQKKSNVKTIAIVAGIVALIAIAVTFAVLAAKKKNDTATKNQQTTDQNSAGSQSNSSTSTETTPKDTTTDQTTPPDTATPPTPAADVRADLKDKTIAVDPNTTSSDFTVYLHGEKVGTISYDASMPKRDASLLFTLDKYAYIGLLPNGIGTSDPYVWVDEVWRVDLTTKKLENIFKAKDQTEVGLPWYSVSPSETKMAYTEGDALKVQTIGDDSSVKSYTLPDDFASDVFIGDATFSPNEDLIAVAAFKTNVGPEGNRPSAVFVISLKTGKTYQIKTSDKYLYIKSWVDANNVEYSSNGAYAGNYTNEK